MFVRSGPKEPKIQLVGGETGGNDSVDEKEIGGPERNLDGILPCPCYFVGGMVLSVCIMSDVVLS